MARTARPRLVRVRRTYRVLPRGKLPALVRTACRRLVGVARTYSTHARGRTCQLRAQALLCRRAGRREEEQRGEHGVLLRRIRAATAVQVNGDPGLIYNEGHVRVP